MKIVAVGRCGEAADVIDVLAEGGGGEPELETKWPRYSTEEAVKVHFSRLMVRPWRWQS